MSNTYQSVEGSEDVTFFFWVRRKKETRWSCRRRREGPGGKNLHLTGEGRVWTSSEWE